MIRNVIKSNSCILHNLTGSCAGDSGGPLFRIRQNSKVKQKKYVLIGITSRGTGVRGNCGGLENPTHYVRIKLFLEWIRVGQKCQTHSFSRDKSYFDFQRYIEKEDLCLVNSDEMDELLTKKELEKQGITDNSHQLKVVSVL